MLQSQNDKKRWPKDTKEKQHARSKEGNIWMLWRRVIDQLVKWKINIHLGIEATGSLDTDVFGKVVAIIIIINKKQIWMGLKEHEWRESMER